MTVNSPASDQARLIRCMEIWGGNEAFDNAIAMAGIDAWIYSRPFRDEEKGGDIHYVSTCGHGHIARFAVADVSGHGAQVAELSARLRSLMRKHINKLDQTRFIRALNKEFSLISSAGRFATAILTSYYAPTDHLLICNAGHPPPLWYRAEHKSWTLLKHDVPDHVDKLFNLPLGIVEPTYYEQFAVKLDKNDIVILYTDWLPEAVDAAGRLLGMKGLLELARSLDVSQPGELKQAILDRVAKYRGGGLPDDDVTLIVLHHNAADPPSMSVGEYLKVLGKVFRLVKV